MKLAFIKPAKRPGVTMAEACRKYNTSQKTGYKGLNPLRLTPLFGLDP